MVDKTIAIIDSDPVFLQQLEDLLQENGYQTRSYTVLTGTFEALCADQPDAAIIGLHFPEQKHGIDLVTLLKLRPETRPMPIIITSDDVPFLTTCGERLRERAVPRVWTQVRPLNNVEMLRLLQRSLQAA